MMNQVTLMGRLVRDPELKVIGELKEGGDRNRVASFSIAVDNYEKDEQGQHTTSFFNCVAWNRTADFVHNYGRKGLLISIVGRLSQRTFERKDGSKGSVTEIVVNEVGYLEPRQTKDDGDDTTIVFDKEEKSSEDKEIEKLEKELAKRKATKSK